MVAGTMLFSTLILCLFHLAVTTGSYESFRRAHGRDTVAEADSVSYEARQEFFHRRKAEALAHNARKVSWTMAVNKFSDHTDNELRVMLGYKRTGSRWSGQSSVSGASSLIQEHQYVEVNNSKLAKQVDWRHSLKLSSTWVRNQGSCGSCWAVAAIGALEMHAEKMLGSANQLSYQQLVDCVPNPRHCGGTGGCKGATGELAFEFARSYGISADRSYQTAAGGSCNPQATPVLKVAHFVRLPTNSATNLFHALATEGPVTVSVDGGNWFGYNQGVFSGCEKDTVVNHAVLAVGYGAFEGKDYWLIRNSWGPDWGEQGFMRIERHTNDDDYCGIDNAPKDGVYCDDAPAKITVCGMCGITSDSAYPKISRWHAVHQRLTRTKFYDQAASAVAGVFS